MCQQLIGWKVMKLKKSKQNNALLFMSAIFLRCTKIFSQHHPFMSFLPSPFLPCKDTFMDDYDGI
jgi:hypothetical protein